MSLPLTLAVLGAALLHASWNVLLKSGGDKELETISIAVGSGVLALATAPFLPAPAAVSWPWLVASASCTSCISSSSPARWRSAKSFPPGKRSAS